MSELTKEDFIYIEKAIMKAWDKAFEETPEKIKRRERILEVWKEIFGDHRPSSFGEAMHMAMTAREIALSGEQR